jgi:DNA-binding NtrC family response regulator
MSGDARPPPAVPPIDATAAPVILVVDDEREIRCLACETLEEHGFHVMSARDAKSALAILRAIVPDVLFTDVIMPGGLDGLQLAKAAEELHPSIKIIVTTGFDFRLANRVAEKSRPMLRKPYHADQLIAEIENALAG